MDDDRQPPALDTAAGAGAAIDRHPDRIEIAAPLRSEYLAPIRTMTAALAADAGFSVDEIDDMRLALGEVVTAYLDRAGPDVDGARVIVTFVVVDDTLTVSVRPDRGEPAVRFDELAGGILGAVVDTYVVDEHGVTLAKRAIEAAAAADAPR